MLMGNQQIRADKLVFDQQNNKASFSGDIYYWGHDLYLHGDSAYLELDNETGTFKNTRYMIKHHRGQGQADTLLTKSGLKHLCEMPTTAPVIKMTISGKYLQKKSILITPRIKEMLRISFCVLRDLPVFL